MYIHMHIKRCIIISEQNEEFRYGKENEMKMYNRSCPFCGHLNKHLYLEETDGWMECEKCHKDSKVMDFCRGGGLPVFASDGVTLRMQANGSLKMGLL